MKGHEAGKAVGLAVAILALNLMITTVAISADVLMNKLVGSREVPAFEVADWSAPIGGGLLFFLASWALGRRRPERSALGFAALAWLAYVIVDVGSGLAMGGARSMLSMEMAFSMGLALLGAVAGSALAGRRAGPMLPASNPSTLET